MFWSKKSREKRKLKNQRQMSIHSSSRLPRYNNVPPPPPRVKRENKLTTVTEVNGIMKIMGAVVDGIIDFQAAVGILIGAHRVSEEEAKIILETAQLLKRGITYNNLEQKLDALIDLSDKRKAKDDIHKNKGSQGVIETIEVPIALPDYNICKEDRDSYRQYLQCEIRESNFKWGIAQVMKSIIVKIVLFLGIIIK